MADRPRRPEPFCTSTSEILSSPLCKATDIKGAMVFAVNDLWSGPNEGPTTGAKQKEKLQLLTPQDNRETSFELFRMREAGCKGVVCSKRHLLRSLKQFGHKRRQPCLLCSLLHDGSNGGIKGLQWMTCAY